MFPVSDFGCIYTRVLSFCLFVFLAHLCLCLFRLLVVGLGGIFLSRCLVRLWFFFVLWSFRVPGYFLRYHNLFLLSILSRKLFPYLFWSTRPWRMWIVMFPRMVFLLGDVLILELLLNPRIFLFRIFFLIPHWLWH